MKMNTKKNEKCAKHNDYEKAIELSFDTDIVVNKNYQVKIPYSLG